MADDEYLKNYNKWYPNIPIDKVIDAHPTTTYGSVFHDGGSALLLAMAICSRMKQKIAELERKLVEAARLVGVSYHEAMLSSSRYVEIMEILRLKETEELLKK